MTFPLTFIPYINIVLLIVVVLFTWRAFKKGFLILFLETVSLLTALILAGLLAKPLAQALPLYFVDEVLLSLPLIGELFSIQINTFIWFILLFISISFILWLLRPIFHVISKIPILKGINHVLGLVFGLIQALVIIWIFSLILLTPLVKNGQEVVQNSAMKYYDIITKTIVINTDFKEMSILKVLSNGSLNDVDRENIVNWLEDSGVISPEKEVVYKILVREQLSIQDIDVLKSWLNEYQIEQKKIDDILERFN